MRRHPGRTDCAATPAPGPLRPGTRPDSDYSTAPAFASPLLLPHEKFSQFTGIARWRLAHIVLADIGRGLAITRLATLQQWNRGITAGHHFVRNKALKRRAAQCNSGLRVA